MILFPHLLPWLPLSAAVQLVNAARFGDVPCAAWRAYIAAAVQGLLEKLGPILQIGLNVPVFEHRRAPRLLLPPSLPQLTTVPEKLRALAATAFNLIEERPGGFERFMAQAWRDKFVCFEFHHI